MRERLIFPGIEAMHMSSDNTSINTLPWAHLFFYTENGAPVGVHGHAEMETGQQDAVCEICWGTVLPNFNITLRVQV
jgi:hypothetical protein